MVRNTFRTLEEEFSKQEFSRLTDIHLRVGLLSNVEPMLMQNAFRAVTETEYPNQSLTLHIEMLPVLIHCQNCDITSEVENYRFVCGCGKPSANIVQGNELLISRVEFQSET